MALNVCFSARGAEPLAGAKPDELVFSDVVKHQVGPGPVTILNLFPDRGLTDPHVMIVSNRLYLGAGHDKSWDTTMEWTMDRWEIWSTSDLKEWRRESNILPTDTYIGDKPNCWAGDFAAKNGKYFWYFSNNKIDTGVAVADQPGGPYRDALGRPMLPNGLVPVPPYDPEIYEENGKFTVFFGAGIYYAATLADDMISLAGKPEAITVTTADGQIKYTDDKACVFQRDGKYYLVFGGEYCMADHLRGPYEYKGRFLEGGHGSVFEWNGQWYVVQESKDISLFYRGIMLRPLFFNEDKTVSLLNDVDDYAGGRIWNFNLSRQGWRSVLGTTLAWDSSGCIKGRISGGAAIESAMWCLAPMGGPRTVSVRLRNGTSATQARITFETFAPKSAFWTDRTPIDWAQNPSVVIDLKPNDTGFTEYMADISHLTGLKSELRQVRIEPALGAIAGTWEIDSIVIKPGKAK